MLSSRRQQFEFKPALKAQECSFKSSKQIHQEMYQCGQCFDYPHGICKYCYEHCHKKNRNQYHVNAKLQKVKGYFKCECGLTQHKQKKITSKQCQLGQLMGSLENCYSCSTKLCKYCKIHCKHQHSNSIIDGCGCNQFHSKHSIRICIIEQLRAYSILKTEPYNPQHELKATRFINQILSNIDLFATFVGFLKNTFETIFDELETGDFTSIYNWSQTEIQNKREEHTVQEQILELFTEKKFPYPEISSILNFIEQLVIKMKYNLGYLNENIWKCVTFSQTKFFISQYHIILQNMQDYSKDKLTQLVLKLVKIQSFEIKYEFSQFRKIDVYSIENSTPLSRNQIRLYNQNLDKGVHSAELTQLIKSYYRILFDIEITNPILCKLLIILLKCVKIGLQTGLLVRTQVVFKVILNLEKLCRDIDYFNQQKNLGQIQRFFTEQMFNLLSKILMLTYFQLKDEQFIEILNDQILRIDKKKVSLVDKYTQMFFNETFRNDIQIDLFYNGNSEKIQIIWRVFINIVLNYNLNGEYYNQVMNSQKKLNHIIQIMLRENLFIDTILYSQVQQIQIEDLLLWKYQTLTYLDSDFNTAIFSFNCHLSTFLKVNLQSSIELQDILELHNKCEVFLSHKYFKQLNEFEKVLRQTFENYPKVQSAKNLQEDLKFRLNIDLQTVKQAQQQLFEQGVDINIIKFFHFVTQEQFNDINESEAVINLASMMFELLKCMLFYNQQLINQIYTEENCQLFLRMSKKELLFFGKNPLSKIIIKFHTDLFLQNGFIQVYSYCFINPQIFCNHLIALNDLLDDSYSNCSELSSKHAALIAFQKHQIFEILIVILELVITSNEQNHDYAQFHNLCEYLYKKVLLIVINHSKELFRRENAYSPDTSSEGENIKFNRYSQMSLIHAIECLQNDAFNNSLNQSQMSFYSVHSNNQSILFQQKFTIKQLKELQQKQNYPSGAYELAISTIMLTQTFLRFMTLIIDYFNRNQVLEDQEVKEQFNFVEKIEQIHHDTSDKNLQIALEGLDEVKLEVKKFNDLINYSLNFRQKNASPCEIFKIRENNLSVVISQKAIDDIMKLRDKKTLKALNKLLLKIKLQSDDLENEILEQNAIVQVIKKEYRNKSKDQCSHILIDVLVELLQQSTSLEKDRELENPHTIFMSQINYIVQLQRLLQVETKAVQEIIKSIIGNEDTKYRRFKINFDSFLACISTKIIPQLFANIIAYQDQPHISRVINSGKYSIIVLEFVRYLAEGQNTYLQDHVGQSGLLESLLKLLIDLFKSKQIQEIVRETSGQNKIRTSNKMHFQKAVRNAQVFNLKKKDSSTADYLQEVTSQRKNSNKAKGSPNDFMQFEIHSTQGDQYGVQVSQTFLKLFAHTIITIAEFNQGQEEQNQKLTSKYLSQFRIWTVIIQILTVRTNEKQQNSVYTLRVYIFQLILSLLEDPDKSSDDFQYIMNLVNHKLLEETLTQTYRALIIFNKLDLRDLSMIDAQLTELYRQKLGDNINESLIFDSTMLIKILYQIYKMLNLYSTSSLEIRQYLNDQRQSCQLGQQQLFKREGDHLVRSAFQFIFNIVGSIEYVYQKDSKDSKETLETFHFLKPPMCFFLSAETKLQFLTETIDRSNPASKLASIFDSIPSFMTEMKENMTKYRKSLFFQRLISVAISPNFHHRQIAVCITVLNFFVIILIANSEAVLIDKDEKGTILRFQESHSFTLYFSEILLIFVSLLALVCQLFFRMSIYHQISCNELKPSFYNTFIVIFKILLKRDIFQFFLHFLLSILGIFEPFFFYLQSFCFIYISKTMSSVLEALRIRWVQFLGIFSVLLIILNAYSYIGFRRFTTSFQMDVIVHQENDIQEQELLCDTPAHCFISLVYLGLREGSGLAANGDKESYHKSSDYYPRFLFDFSFFIIVTLIMINIINGIIIDTFAELRDKQQQNEYDRNNVCVICSLERWEFEKQGLQFSEHVNEVHNLSNYIAFLVHLFQVGKQNMNGIETYIYTKIQNRDMSWTPQKQTSQLNDKI